MGATKVAIAAADLSAARAGSFYTILGAGGDLSEWTGGYDKLLVDEKIGKPVGWFQTTGAAVNAHRAAELDDEVAKNDKFPADLTILMFPLDGLDVGRLAMFKIRMQDRWFDDVLDNMDGAR